MFTVDVKQQINKSTTQLCVQKCYSGAKTMTTLQLSDLGVHYLLKVEQMLRFKMLALIEKGGKNDYGRVASPESTNTP